MPHISWSPAALNDFVRLQLFLSERGDFLAERATRVLEKEIALLGRFPHLGKSISAGKREWSVAFGRGAYRVIYRVEPDQIMILYVRHSLQRPLHLF